MGSESTLAARLRSINLLNICGLAIVGIGLALSLGNFARFFVTIPRFGLFVGAVGGAVMLAANLLYRQTVARANAYKTVPEPADPRPTHAASIEPTANIESRPDDPSAIVPNLSRDERRYAIAMLYLSQFAIFHDDFFKAIDVFDETHLVPMPDSNQGRKRFFDQSANAAISIGHDACMIQLIGTELDKFVGQIEAALSVSGGTVAVQKVDALRYAGRFFKEGRVYSIQATLESTGEKPTLSVGIWRPTDA